MDYSTKINGLDVEAHYSDKSVNEIFLPILRYITKLQRKKDKRVLVILAAPPGAGKSTLLSFLKFLSENTEDIKDITTIGMDGFHHYQDYLLSHTTDREGEIIPMVKIKGAPVTFDLDLLIDRIKLVADGMECGWPEYDRLNHNPREDAIIVTGNIVLLEGNYLLLKEEGWRDIAGIADLTIKISAKIDDLRSRLINRKIMTGVSRQEAESFVDKSDLYNARLCIDNSMDADIELELQSNDEYVLIKGREFIDCHQ